MSIEMKIVLKIVGMVCWWYFFKHAKSYFQRRKRINGMMTVDSLGITLGDSQVQIEKVLKSKNILYRTESISDIMSEKLGTQTEMFFQIKNNIGMIDMEFVFDEDQKLVSHTVVYPKEFDFTNDLIKLEEQRGSRVQKARGQEKAIVLKEENILENLCLSADNELVSLIGQRDKRSVYDRVTRKQLLRTIMAREFSAVLTGSYFQRQKQPKEMMTLDS